MYELGNYQSSVTHLLVEDGAQKVFCIGQPYELWLNEFNTSNKPHTPNLPHDHVKGIHLDTHRSTQYPRTLLYHSLWELVNIFLKRIKMNVTAPSSMLVCR